jgi:transcriptional regulator with XRE-family HTH domain
MPLLGTRLREWRDKRGYTQENLADLLGISSQQIYRYESGKNDPTADLLSRMAKTLGVSADFLLGLVDDPSTHLEEELTQIERKLLTAWRNGEYVRMILMISQQSLGQSQDKTP